MDFSYSSNLATSDWGSPHNHAVERPFSSLPGRKKVSKPVSKGLSRGKRLIILAPGEAIKAEKSPIEELFNSLSATWESETRHLSSLSEKAVHPAYQRIIGLGPQVVPILIERLRKKPGWWFWALRALTGVDPVPEASRGRPTLMAEAWTNWWDSEGIKEGWQTNYRA